MILFSKRNKCADQTARMPQVLGALIAGLLYLHVGCVGTVCVPCIFIEVSRAGQQSRG